MNEPKSRGPRLIGAALIVLAAAGAGFLAYRLQQAARPDPNAVPRPIAAEPAVPPQQSGNAPAKRKVPDTLPDITLADREGKPTRLASFGGRPLMVNFWATWCAPCRREIPLLNKISVERKAQNAVIVGIAVDFTEDVREFVQETPLHYPLLMGEEEGLAAAEAFGMGMALPFSVFVDSQNRILTVKLGELHEDEANFAFDRLKDIDNGVLSREAAQAAVADAFRQMAADRANKEAAQSNSKPD